MSPVVHARWLTTLCYGAMMALAIGLNLLPVFLTALAPAYGENGVALTDERLGRLGAILFSGLVVGILATGPLADRHGAKPFALAGNALGAVALLAAAFAPSYLALGAALFVLGLGAGILDMVLSPVVAALNPARRAAAMNWLHSFYCVGAAVTILVGTLLLRAGLGWRAACLALLPLPLGLLLLLARERFPAMSEEGRRTPLRGLVRSRWFVGALVAIFLGGATELGMAQWLPAYAERELGYPNWVAGYAFLGFAIAMALGRMVIGQLDAKRDSYLVMAWSCGITAALFLIASFFPHPAVALGACIAAGFTGSSLWPTLLAVTADRHPEGGATMFGALAALGNAGGICMPWLVGFVADLHSLAWGLATSAIAPAVLLPLVLKMRRAR